MSEQNLPETGAGEAKQPQFSLQRIYVRDLSFESPMAGSARAQFQPAVTQDLNTKVNKVGDNLYEVVLMLTITVKQQEEDKVAFLAEVQQAGLFHAKDIDGPQLQHLLSATCPGILFPYAREAIDNLVVRGGFPPLMIPPINFDAVYAQAAVEAKARAEAGAGSETH